MDKRAGAAIKVVAGLDRSPDPREAVRIAEALLFASPEPLSVEDLKSRLPEGAEVEAILQELAAFYADRGVNLVRVAGRWAFRTAGDLSYRSSPATWWSSVSCPVPPWRPLRSSPITSP